MGNVPPRKLLLAVYPVVWFAMLPLFEIWQNCGGDFPPADPYAFRVVYCYDTRKHSPSISRYIMTPTAAAITMTLVTLALSQGAAARVHVQLSEVRMVFLTGAILGIAGIVLFPVAGYWGSMHLASAFLFALCGFALLAVVVYTSGKKEWVVLEGLYLLSLGAAGAWAAALVWLEEEDAGPEEPDFTFFWLEVYMMTAMSALIVLDDGDKKINPAP
jgi:hypothetical protein